MRAYRNTCNIGQLVHDGATKIRLGTRVQDIQELISDAATADGNTSKSRTKEVDDVWEADGGLLEMLACIVPDIGDRDSVVTELFDQCICIGNGRNLISDCFIDEQGHRGHAVETHLRIRAEVFGDSRLGNDVVAVVEVRGRVLSSKKHNIATEAACACLIELSFGCRDQLLCQSCFKSGECDGQT
jgi:hypothetical protein